MHGGADRVVLRGDLVDRAGHGLDAAGVESQAVEERVGHAAVARVGHVGGVRVEDRGRAGAQGLCDRAERGGSLSSRGAGHGAAGFASGRRTGADVGERLRQGPCGVVPVGMLAPRDPGATLICIHPRTSRPVAGL